MIQQASGGMVKIENMFEIHWDMHIVVSIDDYELGSYLVKKC